MLIQLKIENVALIEIIEINFEKGLNIITGDSGSGKSLILDSLNALFGGTNIPLKHLIRPGKDFCVIEAIYSSSFQVNNWLISNGFEITSSELRIKRKSYKKNNKIISSTILRKKIRLGQIVEVNKLLNRYWSINGKVIKGQRRGRKIGFPTCNLKLSDYVVPKLGVYAVKVKSKNFYKNGIANIGYRPTFKGQNLLLETNIFGINENLYNKVISVNFKKFIRPEKKFRNLNYLKKQIKLDIKQAKK